MGWTSMWRYWRFRNSVIGIPPRGMDTDGGPFPGLCGAASLPREQRRRELPGWVWGDAIAWLRTRQFVECGAGADRKSGVEGKRGSVRVNFGGRRYIKKK